MRSTKPNEQELHFALARAEMMLNLTPWSVSTGQ